MIMFRKGRDSVQMPLESVSVAQQVVGEDKLESKSQEITPAALEWWEKPSKYSRANIDETEIEQINSGGAERFYQ